jgi:hypothetical protein
MRVVIPARLAALAAANKNIIVISATWGVLYVLIDGIVLRGVLKEFSLFGQALRIVTVCYLLFGIVAFGGSAFFLLRRKLQSALFYLASACIVCVSIYASLAVKGDRFAFTSAPHSEIADIYNQRRSEFGLTAPTIINQTPRLVALDEQCRPPSGCECWIVVDPAHTSGVEQDIGGWHRPKASIFPTDTFPRHFEIVNVRQLDSDAYSAMGCEADWTSWRPGW